MSAVGVQAVVFVLYLLLVVIIGGYAARFNKTIEDYFLADRKLGSWVAAISSTASSESGWVTLGAVGMAYTMGISAVWFVPGCLLGYVFNWYFVAPRLRKTSRELNSLTIPDHLEASFGDKSHIVRLTAVIILFASMMSYVAAQFTASGKALDAAFGIEYKWGVLIGAVITIVYTLSGGFRAVAWTDLLQGIFMVTGLVVLPVMAFLKIGGPGNLMDYLKNESGDARIEVRIGKEGRKALLPVEKGTVVGTGDTGRPASGENTAEKLFEITHKDGLPAAIPIENNRFLINGEKITGPVLLNQDDRIVIFGTVVEFIRTGDGLEVEIRSGLDAEKKNLSFEAGTQYIGLDEGGNVRIGENLWRPVLSIRESENRFLPEVISSEYGRWRNDNARKKDTGIATGDALMIRTASAVSRNESDLVVLGGGRSGFLMLGMIIGLFGIGLGYPGQPHVLTRYMAVRSHREIRRGRVIALTWGLLVYYGAVSLGLTARMLKPDIADPEHALMDLAGLLLHPVFAGILLAAVFAAIKSTADSMLLVASSAVARDVYNKIFRKDARQKELVLVSMLTVLVLGGLSVAVALEDVRVVFWLVLFAWSALGASFGPVIILSLFWKNANRWGAVAGMIIGVAATIVWKLHWSHLIYELIPAFVFSAVGMVFVSLITGGKEREKPGP